MSAATYQTKAPDSLTGFCEAMGILFGKVERRLYRDLTAGGKENTLKRSYQTAFGINARQFNSIYKGIKGKMSSRDECHKRQIKELQNRIKGLEKALAKRRKTLKKAPADCGLGKRRSTGDHLRLEIHHKQRKLARLTSQLARLTTSTPAIIFGGIKLWHAQYNLEDNGYHSHDEWLKDWRDSRSGQFMLVGSKDETAGCQNCQLTSNGNIKIRVPAALESLFGKYVTATGVNFPYGQAHINYALSLGQALTFRFARKSGQWYIFCTTDRGEVPYQSHRLGGMLGVDLNPGVIGWSYCDTAGNLKAKGQIRLNLRDRSSHQVKATLGDAVKQLVDLATQFRCPITVEKLDFSRKKAEMHEQGVQYSRMLSGFAYSQFAAMLDSRAERFGIEVVRVNPAYSSLVGMAKFMAMYGLSSDTAAALVLARRGLRLSERIPANYARRLSVKMRRHVWSAWNMISRKVGARKRHRFYVVRAANSGLVDTLLGESGEPDRLNRKTRLRVTSNCR